MITFAKLALSHVLQVSSIKIDDIRTDVWRQSEIHTNSAKLASSTVTTTFAASPDMGVVEKSRKR
jgi:hypothetical protein